MMADSFDAITRRIHALADEGAQGAGRSLRIIGETILTDVKASGPGRGVPVDTGALRRSGRAVGPEGAETVKVTLAFGGPAAPYALRQHEELDYHHEVGEARYLVRGLERFAAEGGDAARKALEANMDAALARARRVG